MTTPRLQPDDPAVQAWIDRRLDPAHEAELETQLAADPALQSLARHGRRQNALLGQAFGDLLDEPVPERLRQAVLDGANRPGANAPDMAMTGATMPGATMPGATMPGATMPGATASGATMTGVVIPGAMSDATQAASSAAAPRPASGQTGTVGRGGAANRARWQMAAAVMLALVVGFAAGWGGRERVMTARGGSATGVEGISLTRAAAVAHVAYAPEVRHPVEVAASDQAHLVAWLSKRLGTKLRVPDLSAQGYWLVGGRLLPDSTGAVAAQFMFECSQGARLTLFVRRDAQGNDTAFRFAQEGGLSTFYWLDRGYGYALSGDQPREFMLTVADSVYRQLNP